MLIPSQGVYDDWYDSYAEDLSICAYSVYVFNNYRQDDNYFSLINIYSNEPPIYEDSCSTYVDDEGDNAGTFGFLSYTDYYFASGDG